MKKIDIAGKNKESLQVEVATLRGRLQELAFKSAGAQTAELKERRAAKKDIARLLTALRNLEVDKA